MSKFRVLALDGGGIRGLLTTALLQRLLKVPGLETAFDRADLIAGTSSGGLIALAMADGLGGTTMRQTLERTSALFENGRELFGLGLPWWLGGTLIWAKYGSGPRERALRRLVGERTLAELRKRVLIAAFDLDDDGQTDTRHRRQWKPKLFHNFPSAPSDPAARNDDKEPIWRVAMATTAAPAYFPPFDGYIDGGVYSNNPGMCALAQVLDQRYDPTPKPAIDEIVLLSVGAGRTLKYRPERQPNWGAFRWGVKYVQVTMDGTVGIADYQVARMLERSNGYQRLDYTFGDGETVEIDDVKKTEVLRNAAERVDIDECAAWLKSRWMSP